MRIRHEIMHAAKNKAKKIMSCALKIFFSPNKSITTKTPEKNKKPAKAKVSKM